MRLLTRNYCAIILNICEILGALCDICGRLAAFLLQFFTN
nr:MAG TPA: hypothetical protein [Caudoviricetes sp.]